MKNLFGKKVRWLAVGLLFVVVPAFSATTPDHQVAQVASILLTVPESEGTVESPFRLAHEIVSLSHRYGVDPLLVLAIIKIESNFRTAARSNRGAIGLLQVRPIVLREVGGGISIGDKKALYDPYQNLHVGIRYLNFLLDHYRNDMVRALVAYNMGPTNLDQLLSAKSGFPRGYYRRVMWFYRDFQKRVSTIEQIA